MGETLYIQTSKNRQVARPVVCLQDVAKLSCRDSKILCRNQVRKVFSIPNRRPGRYVIDVIDMIQKIQENEPNVDVTHIGEPTMILTYETQSHKYKVWSWIKTLFVCLVTFFGAAFSIMTFNTDVDVPGLFAKIFEQFMGVKPTGYGVLEITYSIGIGIGVVFFFNHFGRWKITQDPTPIEVEMRLYEDDVDKAIIEKEDRGKTGKE